MKERINRFWNVVRKDDDNAEISLYGDIVPQRPRDFWTNEPIDGNYITPEGFRDDIEPIKDCARITVKLNSGGGDVYTGIAIHNALKALPGEVNVIVEGLAASAASVIMCAGDTVSVYPGSLVMIHGVSTISYDWMNLQDLKKLENNMEAVEDAVATIYNEKTGLEKEELRGLMEAETWMTGSEALDRGFADKVISDAESMSMSFSGDMKTLMINGVNHSLNGIDYKHIPNYEEIKVEEISVADKASKAAKNTVRPEKDVTRKKSGGNKKMTLEELRAQEPELVAQVEAAARDAVDVSSAVTAAVTAERERIHSIDEIADSIPDKELVNQAKYGETPCTAQELAFNAVKAAAKNNAAFLKDMIHDSRASGVDEVKPEPIHGSDEDADVKAVVSAYKKMTGGVQ